MFIYKIQKVAQIINLKKKRFKRTVYNNSFSHIITIIYRLIYRILYAKWKFDLNRKLIKIKIIFILSPLSAKCQLINIQCV